MKTKTKMSRMDELLFISYKIMDKYNKELFEDDEMLSDLIVFESYEIRGIRNLTNIEMNYMKRTIIKLAEVDFI